MKSVKDTLLERRSIRRYQYDPVTPEQISFIHQAIRNTPTSYNGQQYTVIDITDPDIKESLWQITNQKQIKTCSHFLVFCIDYNKISLLARAKHATIPPFTDTADSVIVGTIDASLAMMSALTAACSQGLGTCCVGYARTADAQAVATLLKLPQSVMVVCGLAIGVPREEPDLKPKQPLELLVMHDTYRTDPDTMTRQLQDYDTHVQQYNAQRAGGTSTNDWCLHILDYYREACTYRELDTLRARGFAMKQ